MSNSSDTTGTKARETALAAIKQLNDVFVQREQAIETIWLALLTGQNFLLVGDPGTAKTALVFAAFSHVAEARSFGTLCGSFATEDKMFGPFDIQAFKAGEYRRVIKGRLADCELAFLDEMFKSNDGTLNGMLTALNERKYDGQTIPLWTCGAATNWPEVKSRSENVAALWDRMLLRCHVREVQGNAARLALLEAVDKVRGYKPAMQVTMEDLRAARDEITQVEITGACRKTLLDVEARLEKQGVKNSSRRIGAMQLVLRAKAWLRGDTKTSLDDFDALELGLWNQAEHIEPVCEVIKTIDQKVVSECIQKLAEANRQCNQQVPVAQLPKLIQLAAETANEAKKALEENGARADGRKRIYDEIKKLKATYERLKEQVLPHLAKGAAAGDANVSGRV